MGCGCGQKKKDLEYITELATKYSSSMKVDVQVYEMVQPNGESLFDFEPINISRNNVVFYINYSDYSDRPSKL